MKIEDRIRELNRRSHFQQDQDLIEMQEFYDKMLKDGLIKKPEYTLPQIDTIGKRLYQQMAARK